MRGFDVLFAAVLAWMIVIAAYEIIKAVVAVLQ